MNNFALVSGNKRPQSRRGAVAVLLAATMVVVVGLVAFSVDLGSQAAVKTQMRAAADASALAAAGAMVQSYDLDSIRDVAVEYAGANVPSWYGNVTTPSDVTFGSWDAATHTFTPGEDGANAVRVVLQRTSDRGNPVPFFFGRIFGKQHADFVVEAVAVGAVPVSTSTSSVTSSAYITSTKELSNVVLEFADGSHQKFDSLSGYTGTFSGTGEHAGKTVVGVWVKSGCNKSGDGPGYGEHLVDPGDGTTTVHGQPARGCIPKVTVTFQATGVTFTESGSPSPVRLVQ